jgi:hypothetical protein
LKRKKKFIILQSASASMWIAFNGNKCLRLFFCAPCTTQKKDIKKEMKKWRKKSFKCKVSNFLNLRLMMEIRIHLFSFFHSVIPAANTFNVMRYSRVYLQLLRALNESRRQKNISTTYEPHFQWLDVKKPLFCGNYMEKNERIIHRFYTIMDFTVWWTPDFFSILIFPLRFNFIVV